MTEKENKWIKFYPSLELPKERVSIAYATHDERGYRFAYGYFQFYNGTCGCFWKDGNEQPKVVKAEDIKYWMTVPSLDVQEEPKECMYSKDNYTDEDRKALCEGCEEECEFKPITSVWHDGSETPTDKSKVIVWLGEELNEIVQCHYMYGKFVEKIPTEEYGRYILVGNEIEGYSRQFLSNKKRADLTELVVKWAYFEDLIKL